MNLFFNSALFSTLLFFLRTLPDILQKFVNNVVITSHNRHAVSQWLYCTPLLHFLQNKSQPFKKPSTWITHQAAKPEWWGIVEYENAINHFKGKTTWSM